ncbi:MAG: zinc-ribbon domain containing protein [Bacillota bacterium]|jgi:CxxC-x17-CxxC domain-containing protein
MYQDKELVCKDCGNKFSFTANEQEFYASKGFTNEPGRCPQCRAAKKEQNGGRRNYGKSERQMYPAICSACGANTMVPFQPSGDKPIYCRDCFTARNRQY